jgi:hypothetical protein
MAVEGAATPFQDGNYDHNGGDLNNGHDDNTRIEV